MTLSTITQDLKVRLSAVRDARDLYQFCLTTGGKISYPWANKFLAGEFRNPGVMTLDALSSALDASVRLAHPWGERDALRSTVGYTDTTLVTSGIFSRRRVSIPKRSVADAPGQPAQAPWR